MNKVYFKKKNINEDIAIQDSTLAQQYVAVKKQISDKQSKIDQLMRQVNQVQQEKNILEKNLIAIETKAALAQGQKPNEEKQENKNTQQNQSTEQTQSNETKNTTA
jgi:septal ring factor EnvC (AmiA/AmiB activator)